MNPIPEDHGGGGDDTYDDYYDYSGSYSMDENGEMVRKLKKELNDIKVEMKEDIGEHGLDMSKMPQSYKRNSEKELLMMALADNYNKQYVHLFRDRQPLMLCPLNECNVKKFVCTTVKPSLVPLVEFYHWRGCAEFVADYVTMEQLPVAYKVPPMLYSPSSVLKRQKGTAFDMSNLLCSLLLGAGYDAYVVSGYATREICLNDNRRIECPLLIPPEKEPDKVAEKPPAKKYAVRPPRDLNSKFLERLRRTAQKKIDDEEGRLREIEERKIMEREKPPPDELYGLRVHAWVLVRAGKREVPDDFFIEPFTGVDYPKTAPGFLGIESSWNSANYWTNMQDCSNGCADLSFDMYDTKLWEYMIEGANFEADSADGSDDEDAGGGGGAGGGGAGDEDDEDEEEEKDESKVLDMPATWIEPVTVTQKQLSSGCPGGSKTILYKRASLEKYAEYLQEDGLVTRLQVFEDLEQTKWVRTEEWFANRADHLYHKIDDDEWVVEHFNKGRLEGLKTHRYRKHGPDLYNDRQMHFVSHVRTDGLKLRSDSLHEMIEEFVNRSDRLYYRRVVFADAVPKTATSVIRPILKIVEKFGKNASVDSNADVAVRTFVCSEDKIELVFHRHDETAVQSTREYYKPGNALDKGANLPWNEDMTNSFRIQCPQNEKKSKKLLPVYQDLLDLIQEEQRVMKRIRTAEEEESDLMQERIEQMLENELTICVYDTDRNEKAKAHRLEVEAAEAEAEANKDKEPEMDYLSPFLAQIGAPAKLESSQAYRLKEDCLSDLKQRLIDKANLIQLRFEKETSELHRRQQDYQQKQVVMTKEDEEEYFNYCSEAMFRIHILEMRLNRHKQTAPNKYMAMEQKLRQDARLSKLL